MGKDGTGSRMEEAERMEAVSESTLDTLVVHKREEDGVFQICWTVEGGAAGASVGSYRDELENYRHVKSAESFEFFAIENTSKMFVDTWHGFKNGSRAKRLGTIEADHEGWYSAKEEPMKQMLEFLISSLSRARVMWVDHLVAESKALAEEEHVSLVGEASGKVMAFLMDAWDRSVMNNGQTCDTNEEALTQLKAKIEAQYKARMQLIKKAMGVALEKCPCGFDLPMHLVTMIHSHQCSCGTEFIVANQGTEEAHFTLAPKP